MKLVVNGAEVEVDDRHAKTPLLWVLRDVLGLHGTKFGCGAGFCAACTVLIDGRNMKSCQTATERAVGKAVTTVEGPRVPWSTPSATPGTAATSCSAATASRGRRWPRCRCSSPTRRPMTRAIDTWMSGNLCRCGTYPRIRARDSCCRRHARAGADPAPLVAPEPIEDRTLDGGGVGRPGPSVRPDPLGRDGRRVLEPDRDGAGDPHRSGDDRRRGARRRVRIRPGRQRRERAGSERRRLRKP